MDSQKGCTKTTAMTVRQELGIKLKMWESESL